MLDLTRTQPSTPEERHGELLFLTWWITERIMLAATIPTREEQKQFRSLDTGARTAVDYLFDEDSDFETHATLVGISAQGLRESLLGDAPLIPSRFTEAHRRAIRIRHHWRSLEQRRIAASLPTNQGLTS
jgi:hypothetical protein